MKTLKRLILICFLVSIVIISAISFNVILMIPAILFVTAIASGWALNDLFSGNDYTDKMPPEWCPKCYTPKSLVLVSEEANKNYIKKRCKLCGYEREYIDGELVLKEGDPDDTSST